MAQGITFFQEYFDYMDDMTPDQFYEFMGLIRDLRFNGVDTKPQEVEDKSVRIAWRAVRPVVLKSTTNAKAYEKRAKPQVNKEDEPIVGNEVVVYNEKPEIDRWLNAIYEEKRGSAYDLFNKYWAWYFPDIDTAETYVVNHMSKMNKHVTLR